MEGFKFCMGCLATDVKMIRFSPTLFSSAGKGLQYLGITIGEVQTYNLCFECAALLNKFERFRSKCLRAQNVINQLKQEEKQITKETLLNVNRNLHKLVSTIVINATENISICNHIIHTENLTTTDIKPILDIPVDQIKTELLEETTDHFDNILDKENLIDDNIVNLTHEKENKTKKNGFKTKKKEYKTKKRKATSLDSLSDDEPLINKVTKINQTESAISERKLRKNFNLSFFEGYATVEFLSLEDAKKELLLRKESSNYINSPFKCEFCYRGYEAKGTFDNHMKKHSIDYGAYKCDICHLRFQERRCLCKHRLTCHKRKFSCQLCTYVCFCMHQAKTHVSLHKGKKYPCEECSEIFSMPNSLLMHKRLKHVTECVCDICGDMFVTNRGLYSHRLKVHRQENNEKSGPKCEKCNIHFNNEEAWKRHLVLSAKHNISNGCKNCGETFASAEDLKRHMRVHARKHAYRNGFVKLPSACKLCQKWLSDKSEYKVHMTSQHPLSDVTKKLYAEDSSPFVCELCGLTFKKQCFLTYHQRKHTGERPYECSLCKRTFAQAGSLAVHRSIHTARKFVCTICHRGFTYKSALNKHMKMHLNIRPHACASCDKRFISPCDVRAHRRLPCARTRD